MGFLRHLHGQEHVASADPVDGWLLEPRADAVLDVVGDQFHQDAIRKIAGPFAKDGPTHPDHLAVLVPEPDNPFDMNAIRVDIDRQLVGYLSRTDAMLYGPVVRWALGHGRHLVARAKVVPGGWTRDGTDHEWLVKLHVGSPAETVTELLADRLTAIRSDHRWPGALIAFTGDSRCRIDGLALDRLSSELLAQRAGLSVHARVTKQVQLLVDCDPTTISGNESRAQAYGVEVVPEAEFWNELGVPIDHIDWGVPGV